MRSAPRFLLAARLARRLAAPRSRTETVTTVWLVTAAFALLTFTFLLLGVLGALAQRSVALQAREPVTSARVTDGSRTWFASSQFNVGGARLNRLTLGPNQTAVRLPAGIERWPASGQVLLSPGARELMLHNGYAAALGRGTVVGEVGPAALRDPDEAYVVAGAGEQELRATGFASPMAAFGAPSTVYGDLSIAGVIKSGFLGLAILAAGAVVLLGTVLRSSSRARQRRLAVVQLLGAPTSVVRATVAVTTAAYSLVGAIFAVVLHPFLAHRLADLGVGDVRWWPDQAVLGRAVTTSIAVVTVLMIGRAAVGSVAPDPWATRRDAPRATPHSWRVVPLLIGVFVLGGVLTSQLRAAASGVALPGRGQFLLLAGLLGVLLGGILAAPVLTRAASRIGSRARSLAWRLGAARAAHHASATARIGAAMMVLVMVSGLALAVWTIARDAYQPDAGGTLTVTISPTEGREPGSADTMTWQRDFVADVLGRPDLVAAQLLPAEPTADGNPVPVTYADQLRADDVEYDLTLPAAAAIDVAADLENEHPGQQEGVFTLSLDGPQAVLLGNAVTVLALAFSTLLMAMCLTISLIGMQADRGPADTVLLLSGLSRSRLRVARVAEVTLVALPAGVVAAGTAVLLAETVSRVDDPSIAVSSSGVLALGLPVAVLLACLAVTAWATTPTLEVTQLRRD